MQNGDQSELEELLKAGVDLSVTYGGGELDEDSYGLFSGTSPILHAARCGKPAIFKAIYEALLKVSF